MATKRIESLDAFRGITSTLIMLTHYLLCVPAVCQVENLGYIFDAFSWKLPYFFVLSGYVLTLSFRRAQEREPHPYGTFIKKRVLRLYPLFWTTTIVAALIRLAFNGEAPIEGASLFFNIPLKLEWSFVDLLHSLSLVGVANSWLFNNPAWTLVYEMRYAILFPLIIGLLRWRNISYILFVALAAMALWVNDSLESVDIFYTPQVRLSNICSMFIFLLPYAAGVLLALNQKMAARHYLSLGRASRWIYLIVALLLAITPLWAASFIPSVIFPIASKLAIIVGVVMWIVILMNNNSFAKFFSHPTLVKLGQSSFSIYLWHMPIFTLLYMLLHKSVDVVWIIPLATLSTIAIAQLSFKYIETTFINISKH